MSSTALCSSQRQDPASFHPNIPPTGRLLGHSLDYDAILEVPTTWPTRAALRHARKALFDAKLKKRGDRRHTASTASILAVLEEQAVTVIGTDAAG